MIKQTYNRNTKEINEVINYCAGKTSTNEAQEIVILTSRFTTLVGSILTSNTDHLFNSFGISN
jgi:hypothetical protein